MADLELGDYLNTAQLPYLHQVQVSLILGQRLK